MWDAVQDRIKRRYNNTHDVLTDIIDGKYCKEYCGKGNLLEKDTNISKRGRKWPAELVNIHDS